MASKKDLQTQLQDLYKINKNISGPLTRDECEALLLLLAVNPSVTKIVEIFADKNTSLGKNNALFGGQRWRAERQFKTLQLEFNALKDRKSSTNPLNPQLEADRQVLSIEMDKIAAQNKALDEKVKKLSALTDTLTDANEQLKKENKALKNIVDAIRLRLAKDVKQLLNYDDSEIRKALVKVFKSTLG